MTLIRWPSAIICCDTDTCFAVSGSASRVQLLSFKNKGGGFKVWGLGIRIQGLRCRVQGQGLRI